MREEEGLWRTSSPPGRTLTTETSRTADWRTVITAHLVAELTNSFHPLEDEVNALWDLVHKTFLNTSRDELGYKKKNVFIKEKAPETWNEDIAVKLPAIRATCQCAVTVKESVYYQCHGRASVESWYRNLDKPFKRSCEKKTGKRRYEQIISLPYTPQWSSHLSGKHQST